MLRHRCSGRGEGCRNVLLLNTGTGVSALPAEADTPPFLRPADTAAAVPTVAPGEFQLPAQPAECGVAINSATSRCRGLTPDSVSCTDGRETLHSTFKVKPGAGPGVLRRSQRQRESTPNTFLRADTVVAPPTVRVIAIASTGHTRDLIRLGKEAEAVDEQCRRPGHAGARC